jgi:hypothetical protein
MDKDLQEHIGDPPYSIAEFLNEVHAGKWPTNELTRQFQIFKDEIRYHGGSVNHEVDRNSGDQYIPNKPKIKIYSAELAVFFNTENAQGAFEQLRITVNGKEYFKSYEEGFLAGQQYFKDNFSVPPSTLLLHGDVHVMQIHQHYAHTMHSYKFVGWCSVKGQYPEIVSHKVIKEFGYYAGIVSETEEYATQYARAFKKFERDEECEICKEEKIRNPLALPSPLPPDRFDFEVYLNRDGKALLPKLVAKYKGCKPEPLFAMLFALASLNLLDDPMIVGYKHQPLADALTKTFKRNISHQTVSNNFKRFDKDRIKKDDDRLISEHILKIKSL